MELWLVFLILFLSCKPVFLLMYFFNEMSPDDIFFGVKIDADMKNHKKLNQIKKNYRKSFSYSTLVTLAIGFLFFFLFDWGVIVLLAGVPIGMCIIGTYLFAKMNKLVLLVKQEENWQVAHSDDELFKFGMFYYNKNDKRTWVEKRNGGGYDLNYAKPFAKLFWLGFLIFIVGIIAFSLYSSKPNTFTIQEEKLQIEGSYSQEVSASTIESITLVKTIPEIKIKNNGASIGGSHQGHYRLENEARVKLYIRDDKQPAIFIERNDDEKNIYINLETKQETETFYNELNRWLAEVKQ